MLKRTIMLAVITGLVFTLAPAVWAVDIEMVPVGWAGNEADTTGYGAVDYDYNIGKYEVTAAQWDAYITRNTGTSTDNLPRVHTPWLDMARFVNWLHNGQPATGGTETGAYTIPIDAGNGYTQAGNDITREADWKWAIASEDEWYKAAYHKNDGLAQSYYDYPNSSDTPPTAEIPPGGTNSSNHGNVVGALTEVGAYPNSTSPYGTFDQAGNTWEWTDTLSTVYFAERMARGSAFSFSGNNNQSTFRDQARMNDNRDHMGFRVVSRVVTGVPGDLDDDKDVDADDMILFEGQFGSQAPGAYSADFDGDEDVDLDDFLVMRDNLGTGAGSAPPAGGAATPEPATMAVLAFGGLLIIRRRRKA